MKKRNKIMVCAAIFTILSGAMASFAGEWKTDAKGYWYEKDDGGYAVSEWIADNGKWYYFGNDGYMFSNTWIGNYYVGADGAMLVNTTTPDGYQVGADGAWIKETNVQADYLEKYAEILREMPETDIEGYLAVGDFILAYIDEDAIPELIVHPGAYKPEAYLYTYYQGNAKLAGEFYYGTIFNYIEKGNLIYSDCFQTGANQWDGFYRIENGERIAIAEFYSNAEGSSYAFYEINQQKVPESTYRSQLNAMKGGYSFKKIEDNAFHKINEENIQKMLADMNSAM